MSTTSQSLEQTITALGRMTVTQLRQQHLELFGEPTSAGNKQFLFKRIVWRIQSLAEGTLSERARRRAEELARDADVRMNVPRPPKPGADSKLRSIELPAPRVTAHDRIPIPGTVLTRKYRGRQIDVKVLLNGFEYEGQAYRSLSAVAKTVTGSHWNGHLFFGLTGTGARKSSHE